MTINIIDRLSPLGAFPVADFKNVASVASSQSVWYVDSVAGNDANTGVSSGTALQTVMELRRRLFLLTLPVYEIYILNDLPASDPIGLSSVSLPSTAAPTNIRTRVFWYGQRIIVASGTFTANGTNTVPASNLASSITDSSVADWNVHVGKMLVVTSGPSSGFIVWMLKDLGAGVCRTSTWINPTLTPLVSPSSSEQVPPLSGATYDLVTLTKVNRISSPGMDTENYFSNFDFTNMSSSNSSIQTPRNVLCSSCKFSATIPLGESFVAYGSLFYVTTFSGFSFATKSFLGGCASFSTINGPHFTTNLFRLYLLLTTHTSQNGYIDVSDGGRVAFQSNNGFFNTTPNLGLYISRRGVVTTLSGTVNLYGSGHSIALRIEKCSSMHINTSSTVHMTGTTQISINSKTSLIPPLVAGAAVPAAAPMTTWAEFLAAPFSGIVVDSDGTTLVRN
jgi:hypothetical protein